MCKMLKVKQLRTSVYHPQTDGLVKRFNQTLKQMMRKMITTDVEPEVRMGMQLSPHQIQDLKELLSQNKDCRLEDSSGEAEGGLGADCQPYLNGIVLHSADWKTHLERLRVVSVKRG
ncbi:hypothetical protein SKAU_G00211490 [Synaphobranchus kaupii]|uniref:Integrase catalytic domain-containing protein n=1 Tax=Synaphobranchus kaupii TaxID=118154 RepID=A0A9Q1IU33_SYNKA|nr:hypothetical protein SKAU_G00211490 [Synaphobranchus kaupii]